MPKSLLRNYSPEQVRNVLAVAIGVLSLVQESPAEQPLSTQLARLAGDAADQLQALAEAIEKAKEGSNRTAC